MAYCPAGYSAKNESKPDTALEDSQPEASHVVTESESPKSFLEEFGDKEISFGDKRGTVAEALERCPHLQQLGETALRGVVSAVIASQEQESKEKPEEEKPAKPLLPKSDKPKAHKQTDKPEKVVAAAKETVIAASVASSEAGEKEIEPDPRVAETVKAPAEDNNFDEQAAVTSRNYTAKEAVNRTEDSSFRTDKAEKPNQPVPDYRADAPASVSESAAGQQKIPTGVERTVEPGVDEYDASNEEITTNFTEELIENNQEAVVAIDSSESLESYDNTARFMEPADSEAVNSSNELTVDAAETYDAQEQITEVLENKDLEFDFSEDYEAEEFTPEVLEVFMKIAELPVEGIDEEIEPIENSESLMADTGKAEHRNETPENTAFEDFVQSVSEEVTSTPEDVLSMADEDAPAEECLRQLALMLSEHPETDNFKPAMDAIEVIQQQLYKNLSTQEGEVKTITITPETVDQLMALLRNLGYQNPKEALMELINSRGLRYVMQAVHYLSQLRDTGNRQEFKADPMLFKPTDHPVHHPLGARLGQLAIALTSQGLLAKNL